MRKKIACLATIALTSTSLSAQDTGWLARAVGGWDSLLSPVGVSESAGDFNYHFTNDLHVGLEGEYRFNRRLGLELAIHQSWPDIVVGAEIGDDFVSLRDSITYRPLTVGLDVHLTPDPRADFTLTPLIGHAFFSDLDFETSSVTPRFNSGSDLMWGGAAAVDVGIGDGPWTVSFALRYLDATLEAVDDGGVVTSLDLSPWTTTVGVGYRF